MLILRNDDLRAVLSLEVAFTALTETLHEQATGAVILPPRITLDAPAGAWMRLMPAVQSGLSIMGFKSMNVTPAFGVRSFIGLIDLKTGDVFALLDADYVTLLRTAVTTAIATRLFAPREIEAMTLLGSGKLAEEVLLAVATVRDIPVVYAYSPNPEHRDDFARRMTAKTGITVKGVPSIRAAIRASNLVTGAFRAPNEPSIDTSDVQTGTHINSLSSVRPDSREVTAALWRVCTCIFVDHRAGVAQSGDGLSILRDHPFDLDRAPELWEVVRDGSHRTVEDNITMFKSVGAASQDLALALAAYERSVERGLGQSVPNFPSVRAQH